MIRTLAAASFAALLSVPTPAAPRTTVSLLHTEPAGPRSGAPALEVRILAADPGLEQALDRALADALARHSHAVRVGPDEAPDWVLTLRPDPPLRQERGSVLAFTARLADPRGGKEVWAIAGTVEDDGSPSAESALASLARNLVDRLTQDGWAHVRRDPADPAPPPPRLAPDGTAGDRR